VEVEKTMWKLLFGLANGSILPGRAMTSLNDTIPWDVVRTCSSTDRSWFDVTFVPVSPNCSSKRVEEGLIPKALSTDVPSAVDQADLPMDDVPTEGLQPSCGDRIDEEIEVAGELEIEEGRISGMARPFRHSPRPQLPVRDPRTENRQSSTVRKRLRCVNTVPAAVTASRKRKKSDSLEEDSRWRVVRLKTALEGGENQENPIDLEKYLSIFGAEHAIFSVSTLISPALMWLTFPSRVT